MIALWIIGSILVLLALILLLPVSVWVQAREAFVCQIKFAGVPLFRSDKAKKPEKQKPSEKKQKPEKKAKKTFPFKDTLQRLREQEGFSGTVKAVCALAGRIFSHIKGFLRHIKFRKVVLDITVASDDAARTAIEYGAVCQAVYPVAAYIETLGAAVKKIDVRSDFETGKSRFGFELQADMQIIFLLIAALKILREIKKFVSEKDKNERK